MIDLVKQINSFAIFNYLQQNTIICAYVFALLKQYDLLPSLRRAVKVATQGGLFYTLICENEWEFQAWIIVFQKCLISFIKYFIIQTEYLGENIIFKIPVKDSGLGCFKKYFPLKKLEIE